MRIKASELFRDDWKDKKIVFCITVDDIQAHAEAGIGRELNEDELYIACKCVEFGLSEGIDIVMRTAIQEGIDG